MASRNASSCLAPIVRVLPNQRRLGAMRAAGAMALSPVRLSIMSAPPITLPFLLRMGPPLLYMRRRFTVSLLRVLESPLPRFFRLIELKLVCL
jgi:hypothetical protein